MGKVETVKLLPKCSHARCLIHIVGLWLVAIKMTRCYSLEGLDNHTLKNLFLGFIVSLLAFMPVRFYLNL